GGSGNLVCRLAHGTCDWFFWLMTLARVSYWSSADSTMARYSASSGVPSRDGLRIIWSSASRAFQHAVHASSGFQLNAIHGPGGGPIGGIPGGMPGGIIPGGMVSLAGGGPRMGG